MFSKGFILSLGLSLCAVVLVYLYVKNRITNLENKVDSLIEIIQAHQRLSQQLGGTQQFEKIVVSDDESEEEDSSSEEENDEEETEEQETLVLENHVVEKENDIKEEVEQQMLQLSNNEEVLEEHEVTPEDDGLDEMDDLEETLDDEENDEDSEEQDYSKLGKVQLRELCEEKGFEVKGKKKHELLELLK